MHITRLLTGKHHDPYHGVSFKTLHVETLDADDPDFENSHEPAAEQHAHGSFTVPSHWSHAAITTLVSHFFLKDGVPAFLKSVSEDGVPQWLWRKEADQKQLEHLPRTMRSCGEHDVRQVFDRIAGGWTYCGWKNGYFDSEADARSFYDEIRSMLVHQLAGPETNQWMVLGIDWAYGLNDVALYPDHQVLGAVQERSPWQKNNPLRHDIGVWSGVGRYDSAMPHAAAGREMNEETPSMMDWLSFMDRCPSSYAEKADIARRSYGPRKVVLHATHPEVEEFIGWKQQMEYRVAAMVTGSRVLRKYLSRIMKVACEDLAGKYAFDPAYNTALRQALQNARAALVPEHTIQQVLHLARQGVRDVDFSVFESDWDGSAYQTAGGARTMTAIRVPHALVEAVQDDMLFDCWTLRDPASGQPQGETSVASLWERMATANWFTGEPAVEFDTTIQQWNTCAESGAVHSSSPSGGYMFLDDTGCYGGTLNLMNFVQDGMADPKSWYTLPDDAELPEITFDVEGFTHVVRLLTIALDIAHERAKGTELFERKERAYRPIGISFGNLAPVLTRFALAYDSDEARNFAGALSAIMTGTSYCTSASLAKYMGPFEKWPENRDTMARVMRNYARAANGAHDGYEALDIMPSALLGSSHPLIRHMIGQARLCWADVMSVVDKSEGFRNAFVSMIVPASKASLALGIRTSGLEPETAITLYTSPSEDKTEKEINPSIPPALRRLGYTHDQAQDIVRYVLGRGTLHGAPAINHEILREKGFTESVLDALEDALDQCFDIRFVFNKWNLGEEFCLETLGLDDQTLEESSFDLLPALGFNSEDIMKANAYCCGALTLEGAPHLKEEHAAVFDCLNPTGRLGKRRVSPSAHVLMAASVGTFLTGSVGTVLTLEHETTVESIKDLYYLAWSLGMKSVAVYREGARLSQSRYADIMAHHIDDNHEESSDEQSAVDVSDQKEKKKHDNVVHSILSTPSAMRAPLIASQIMRRLTERQKTRDHLKKLSEQMSYALDVGKKAAQQSVETTNAEPVSQEEPRRKLPNRRKGYTQKAVVGGHKIYVRTGEYNDGSLGEIFIDMHKEGAAFRSLMNSFAIAVSYGLQYGVPLEDFVEAFTFTRFEPHGQVQDNDAITSASSVLDYVFRELAISYLGRSDLADIGEDDFVSDDPADLVHTKIAASLPRQNKASGGSVIPQEMTADHLRQIISGGYTRQNLKALQGNLLRKLSANSNLAIQQSEDERISAYGYMYEDVDDSILQEEIERERSKDVFHMSVRAIQSAVDEARTKGYEGEPCPACSHMTVLKIGHFMVCETCSHIHEVHEKK